MVYQPLPSPRSVPQKPLLCTNRAPHPVPYLGIPSRVPTVSLTPFRTAEAPPVYQPCPSIPFRTTEAPPVYQPCPSPRSVPQKPLPCTNRVPPSRSVPQKPLPCTNRAPHLVLCRESTLFEPNSAHNIWRMAVICLCLRLRETMSPLRTVSSQACDGSARWMNGSRSGVFGPDPTS